LLPVSKSSLDSIDRQLKSINNYIDQANTIIDTILGYARREIPERAMFALNKVIFEAIEAVKGVKERELGVEVTLELDESIEEILIIQSEMRRAFINLFENAWNILIDKKEQIDNFEPKISIITQKIDNNAIIKIKDNGFGIEESLKNKIFNPFFSTRKKKQGTGLGLYFVWEIIVNEHGGTISVESIEGEGAEFVVSIPIRG
jgi:two-component system, NtrC family, sensor kinase